MSFDIPLPGLNALLTTQGYLSALAKDDKVNQEAKSKTKQPHRDFIPQWIQAMEQGTIGKHTYVPKTIKQYRNHVEPFLERYKELSIDTLEQELIRLPADQYATKEMAYRALICFAKLLIRRKVLPSTFLEEAKEFSPKENPLPNRPAIDRKQVILLLKACTRSTDRLLISVLVYAGLRAKEACDLQWRDIDFERIELTVQCGKGSKKRKIGLMPNLKKRLARTYEKKKPLGEDYVFYTTEGKPFKPENLNKRVARVGETLDIDVSPHVLRRFWITSLIKAGVALPLVQAMAGHSDIKTTMAYCRTTEDDAVDAVKNLKFFK